MKKHLLIALLAGCSLTAYAETYDISAKYIVGAEYEGNLTFKADEGKLASYSDDQLKTFGVIVHKKSDEQVIMNLDFVLGEYSSKTDVVLDLNREAELDFGDQKFIVTVTKHSI